MNVVANNQPVSPQDWLVKVNTHNKSLPPNLRLFCGDRNLDLLADPLLKRAAGDVTTFFNPYRSVACACHTFRLKDVLQMFWQLWGQLYPVS